jgi:hypothetical protein
MSTSSSVESGVFKVIPQDYQWSVNKEDEGTVTILKYLGTITPDTTGDSALPTASLNVPYILDGKLVTIIGPNAYANNTVIDRIVIHSDIITIGEGAFSGCTNLRYLSFYNDSKVKYIKKNAFLNTAIKTPVIPDSVISIEDGAFDTQVLKMVTFNGNAPVFTENSFNSQSDNENYKGLITIIYYTNAVGFNNPNDTKFFLITNNKMIELTDTTIMMPTTSPVSSEPPSNVIRNIIYFLLFVLLIVAGFFIYTKFIKNKSGISQSNPSEPINDTNE